MSNLKNLFKANTQGKKRKKKKKRNGPLCFGAASLLERAPAEVLLGSGYCHPFPCHQLASFPKQIDVLGWETDFCLGGGPFNLG